MSDGFSVDFNEFINWLDKFGLKRLSNTKNIEEVVSNITSEHNEWKNVEIKDWMFLDKESNKEIEYLVAKEWKEIIRKKKK